MIEQTLLVIKPDAIKNRLVGKIITRIEEEGFAIKEINVKSLTEQETLTMYEEHRGKNFFDPLLVFMRETPVVALILERKNGLSHLREIVGKTDPKRARAGTIRALYGTDTRRNVVHASDSNERFLKEVELFF